MAMKINTVKPARGAVKKRKRLGRGTGSGHGGTSTRGHKGVKARSGPQHPGLVRRRPDAAAAPAAQARFHQRPGRTRSSSSTWAT